MINPQKEYTIKEMNDLKLFPWTHCVRTISRIAMKDYFGENMLKTRIEGTGKLTRYHIKGKHIIQYLNKYGNMLSQGARKPKQLWKNKQPKRLRS